jgi:hypothetical protein
MVKGRGREVERWEKGGDRVGRGVGVEKVGSRRGSRKGRRGRKGMSEKNELYLVSSN